MFNKQRKGQSTLEYALLIAAVVAGLVMMQVYVKRGVGGKVKSSADDIGEQFDPVAFRSSYTTTQDSERREVVANKVTTSTLTADERATKTGSETVDAWSAGEDLYRTY